MDSVATTKLEEVGGKQSWSLRCTAQFGFTWVERYARIRVSIYRVSIQLSIFKDSHTGLIDPDATNFEHKGVVQNVGNRIELCSATAFYPGSTIRAEPLLESILMSKSILPKKRCQTLRVFWDDHTLHTQTSSRIIPNLLVPAYRKPSSHGACCGTSCRRFCSQGL